jgi:hypothetical protein
VGLTCLRGTGQWSGEYVGLWIEGLEGLRGTSWWKSCGPVDHQPGRPEGCSPAKIVGAYGLLACQAWEAWPSRDHAVLRSGSLREIWQACEPQPWQG